MDSFLFVGEHSVMDFVNTELKPSGELIDLLKTKDDVKRWFRETSLISDTSEIVITDTYFSEIKEYRDFMKKSFFDYLKGKDSLDALTQRTNQILKENEVFLQVEKNEDGFNKTFEINKKNLNVLLTTIAIEVVKLLSLKYFKYLKRCSNHECVLLFIDTSKNHSRKWCSMETCGNRTKVSRFSKRKKEKLN